MRALNNVIGFDDAPFDRQGAEKVLVVGTVFSGRRLDGVLSTHVCRDGDDSTTSLIRLLASSRFLPQLQLIFLQGIAFAGFNVVDIHALHTALGLPVLVVMRRPPDRARIREVLLSQVPDGKRKWRLVEAAGGVEPLAGVYVQRAGMGREIARATVEQHAYYGRLPEPLRVAHLVAGGVARGESRHRA